MIAARETCHALGLPHVTLDLREEFRRAVVEPFVRGYARGETPNPCTRCNGGFRFAELLAFARRAGAARLATGHYARIVEHRGRLLLARAADPDKDQSYMLAPLDPAKLDRLRFPLGEQTKDETRAEAAAAGLAAAARAGEPGGVLPRRATTTARSSSGMGSTARTGADRRRGGPRARRARRLLALHAGPASRARRRRRPSRSTRCDRRATNTVVVGPRASLARTAVSARGRLYVPVDRAEAKLRYRSPAVAGDASSATDAGFRLELDEPAYGVAAGPGRRPLRRRRRRRLRVVSSAAR